MVDPNLELSRGPGFDLLALLAFLPSAISSFFTHIYFTWRNLLLNLKKTEKNNNGSLYLFWKKCRFTSTARSSDKENATIFQCACANHTCAVGMCNAILVNHLKSANICIHIHSYENEFCMQFHFHANQSHCHNNGFTLRLVLKQRHKGTRKWPIRYARCHTCRGACSHIKCNSNLANKKCCFVCTQQNYKL